MNITSLVGHAGGRATLTTTTKGTKIANFSIATVERYKDNQGVQKKHTDWHKVAVFGPFAEVVEKFVDKGTVVCVTGALHNEAYTDKAGKAQPSSTLHANFFEVMSGGKKADSPEQSDPKTPAIPNVGDSCPKCGSGTFIKKTIKTDDFMACNKYPACKNLIKIIKAK